MGKVNTLKITWLFVQLFIIFKSYDLLNKSTGMSFRTFLLVAFILFWIINYLASKLYLARDIPHTLLRTILPVLKPSADWFTIGIITGVAVGFFVGRGIPGALSLLLLLVIAGASFKLLTLKGEEEKMWGAIVLSIGFGIITASPLFSKSAFLVLFAFGYIILYIVSEDSGI